MVYTFASAITTTIKVLLAALVLLAYRLGYLREF
jgi:hypothetical protein